MEIRLTVVDPQRAGASVDVAISAKIGTPFSAVIGQLLTVLGWSKSAGDRPAEPGPQFRCGAVPVEASAPLGLPPLLDGAVLALLGERPGRAGSSADPEPLLEAQVIAGPDAGLICPLAPGRHSIGRASSNSIRLADPDASRVHAQLMVEADRIELRDAGSSNGTWRHGRRIGRTGEPLPLGDPIVVGASTIAVRRPDRPPAAATADGEGHLRINRGPQLHPPRVQHQIDFPAAPPQRAATRLPWPAMLLPLVLAVPLAFFWKQPTFLLFALMTPVLMLGQYVADRRSFGRETRTQRARFTSISEQREAALRQAVVTDAAYLEAARPDLARLAVTARTPTDELWRRASTDPEFLVLRLGRGPEPAAVVARRTPTDPSEGREARPGVLTHPDAPVAVNLREVRVLGICGPRGKVLGLARSLIGQASVLHSPRDVQIDVLTNDPVWRREWRWVRWLPHRQPESGRRRAGGAAIDGPSRPRRWRIIVLDGAHALRQRPELATALSEAAQDRTETTAVAPGPESLVFICLDQTEQDLPLECDLTITLDADLGGVPAGGVPAGGVEMGGVEMARTALLRRRQAPGGWVAPDLASARWAERLSRQLAPLRDGTPDPDRGLPSAVNLIELLATGDRVRPTDPLDLARHWRRSGRPEPVAALGVTAEGSFRINLRRDGPHMLLAGTTGAGKSELLQTMVAALAVSCAPDAISFLLIDYKGGAAFRECAALPHVGAAITDLDPQLARRALAALTAELRRRERLLNSISAVDIDAYFVARSRRPDLPALPRLVVIVDEFRVLAEELPEFVSGLIRTATVGRSLGVHLTLATQRPSGVVSAEISANVNLRIALRLRDGADSRDLIDDPAAALLPAEIPGRALARTGTEPLVCFQTARVCGHSSPADPAPVVRVLDPDFAARSPIDRPRPEPDGASDLAAIAAAATAACAQLKLAPISPPWLPPLPSRVLLDDLRALPVPPSGIMPRSTRSTSGDDVGSRSSTDPRAPFGLSELPFGLIDLPDEQRQHPVAWRLGGSHLAVAGGPRSGRTTVLRSLAQAATAMAGPGELHVYVIDGSGALSHLQGSWPVEAVVPVHDTERAGRLLRRIGREIGVRQARIGTGGVHPNESTTAAHSSMATRHGSMATPHGSMVAHQDSEAAPDDSKVLLLIDGWETLSSTWMDVDHGRLIDELISALRDGPAVGVLAAISGGRSLLTGTVSALLAERVVLRFADPADALLAGVPAAKVMGTGAVGAQPVGRGLFLSPDYPTASEIQVAIAPESGHCDPPEPGPADTTDPGLAVTGPARNLGTRSRWRIPELPQRLDYDELLAALLATPTAQTTSAHGQCRDSSSRRILPSRQVPIGIGGDDAVPLHLDLDEAPVTLLIGAPGSGRTSALRCIAAGLRRSGEPVLSVSGRPDRGEELALALAKYPEATVLVDDIRAANVRAAGSPGDGRAEAVGELLVAWGGRLIIASTAGDVLAAYRGILAVGRTARSGLILGNPAPGDGEVFGVRLSRRPPGPAGRALLVQAGQVSPVQLALPPVAGTTPAASPGP